MHQSRNPLALLSFAILLCGPIVWAKDFPDWEREFGVFGQQASVNYNVGLQVKSVETVESKIEKLVENSGGKLISMNANNNGYYGGYNSGNGGQRSRTVKSMAYDVPTEKAEAVSRKILDLGVIQNYNRQQQQPNASGDLDERIKEIEAELGNAAMDNLPAARSMLNAKLGRLKQSRDSLRANADKARINVSLLTDDDGSGAKGADGAHPARKSGADSSNGSGEKGD